MKISEYPLLLDENTHPDVVAFIRSRQPDAPTVGDRGLLGSDDRVLLRLAHDESRVVVTHDSDFGTLAFAANEPFVGIVYIRPGHIRPEFTIESVRLAIEIEVNPGEPFIVVAQRSSDRVKIRVRSFPKEDAGDDGAFGAQTSPAT